MDDRGCPQCHGSRGTEEVIFNESAYNPGNDQVIFHACSLCGGLGFVGADIYRKFIEEKKIDRATKLAIRAESRKAKKLRIFGSAAIIGSCVAVGWFWGLGAGIFLFAVAAFVWWKVTRPELF